MLTSAKKVTKTQNRSQNVKTQYHMEKIYGHTVCKTFWVITTEIIAFLAKVCWINLARHCSHLPGRSYCTWGASKIKLKNVNEMKMATARREIFWGISQGIHCWSNYLLFSSLQNSAAIVLLTPPNFYHFRRPKFNFQPLSFTFETFGKKLEETKIVARFKVKKIKKKRKGF